MISYSQTNDNNNNNSNKSYTVKACSAGVCSPAHPSVLNTLG
jgi:hypothetical protein